MYHQPEAQEQKVAKIMRLRYLRRKTLDNATMVVRKHFGPHYKDAERPHGFEPSTRSTNVPPIYSVRKVARTLIQEGYQKVSYIRTASVPIVSFTDPNTRVTCDMNINHRLGIYNTALLRQYCVIFPPLAPLLRRIKSWARHVELNSSSEDGRPASFSSYALTLMTISFLQSKNLLPNLQRLDTRDRSVVDTHFWSLNKTGNYQKVDVRFSSGSSWRPPPNYISISVFRAWFKYWAFIHDYGPNGPVMTVRDGGIMDLNAATNVPSTLFRGQRSDGDLRLVVLDPFLAKNCTAMIKSSILHVFKAKCTEQWSMLRGLNNSQLMRTAWNDLLVPP
ncbi:hypothetical protein C8Q74DRAFT_1017771 [Fomes fomentarius]|nr:hypothetical protein C8Q74DRAFT_1017771 [Fomes fomentarius]